MPQEMVNKKTPYLRRWTEDDMRNALSKVQTGRLSYRKAAQQYGIQRSMIRDHLTGLVEIGRRSGLRLVLSKEEEEAIVQWLIKMARIGYGRDQRNKSKTR